MTQWWQIRHSDDIEDTNVIGAEVVIGTMPIGQVVGVQRDPISQRVWHLLTAYGPTGRRVAVPMEWVVRCTPGRVTLGVDLRSLDDLADQSVTTTRTPAADGGTSPR
jgi:hypothetical protein